MRNELAKCVTIEPAIYWGHITHVRTQLDSLMQATDAGRKNELAKLVGSEAWDACC